MTDVVKIRSADGSATLEFAVTERTEERIAFAASYSSNDFQGSVLSSTYLTEPPSRFFAALVSDWKNERAWQDLERAVKLRTKSDSTGHVTLYVELTNHDARRSLSGFVVLELGQLDAIAAAMRAAFGFETIDEHRAWTRK